MPPRGLAHGAVVTVSGQVLRFIIQIAGLAALSRLLSPVDFGQYAAIAAIAGIAAVLGDFGLSLAAVQRHELDQRTKSSLFWLNTAIGAVIALVVLLLAPVVAAFYRSPGLTPLTAALALAFLFSGMTAQYRAELNRGLDFLGMTVGEVTSQGLGLGVGVVMAVAGYGAWSLVAQQIVAALAVLIMFVVRSRWRPTLVLRWSLVKDFLGFGTATAATQVANYVSVNVGPALIGRYLGSAPLGLYNRAFQIFMLPLQQLAAPLTRVFLPRLRGLAPGGLESMGARLETILGYSLVPLFMVMAATASNTVVIVLGARWSESAPILSSLAIGGVFQALGYVYYWLFLSSARMKLLLISEAPGRVVMVLAAFATAPFSITLVSWGYALGLVVNFVVASVYGIRRLGLSRRKLLSAATRPFLLFGVASASAFLIDIMLPTGLGPVVKLIIQLAVIALVASVGLLGAPSVRADIRMIQETISRRGGQVQ